jgi:hypothetical protein
MSPAWVCPQFKASGAQRPMSWRVEELPAQRTAGATAAIRLRRWRDGRSGLAGGFKLGSISSRSCFPEVGSKALRLGKRPPSPPLLCSALIPAAASKGPANMPDPMRIRDFESLKRTRKFPVPWLRELLGKTQRSRGFFAARIRRTKAENRKIPCIFPDYQGILAPGE